MIKIKTDFWDKKDAEKTKKTLGNLNVVLLMVSSIAALREVYLGPIKNIFALCLYVVVIIQSAIIMLSKWSYDDNIYKKTHKMKGEK